MSKNSLKKEESILRETIEKQRDGLLATRKRLELELASYDGAIQSLELLLKPEETPEKDA